MYIHKIHSSILRSVQNERCSPSCSPSDINQTAPNAKGERDRARLTKKIGEPGSMKRSAKRDAVESFPCDSTHGTAITNYNY